MSAWPGLFQSQGLMSPIYSGAAFIAVWFTKVVDLFSSAEELWEGVFSLIAYVCYISGQTVLLNILFSSILIFVMGLTMLRMDRAKEKWRVKLTDAFEVCRFARV